MHKINDKPVKMSAQSVIEVARMLDFETSSAKSEVSKSNWWKITLLKNYVTSEGAVSHNVFYYRPLPITCYQVRFYANNYFE